MAGALSVMELRTRRRCPPFRYTLKSSVTCCGVSQKAINALDAIVLCRSQRSRIAKKELMLPRPHLELLLSLVL
jgi:hypothetical protein